MSYKSALGIILTLFVLSISSAQEIKFGKVSKGELEETFYPGDSTADAVVLLKKRNTYYKYDNGSGWSVVTDVMERIKIYNQDGFEWATKKIPIYIGQDDETVLIKAYTYNLENGKVTKTKLERKDIFEEEVSERWATRNFTMPNLKEGCIVEWKYSKSSPYTRNIDEVICQYGIPIKELDVRVRIPEFYVFKNFPSRYYPLNLQQSSAMKTVNYAVRERSGGQGFSAIKSESKYQKVDIKESIYTIKQSDITALEEEPYVNNIDNYRATVRFEISAYRPANGTPEFYNNSWEKVTREIYQHARFGGQLSKKGYFKKDLEAITASVNAPVDQMTMILEFVKSKIAWNEKNGKYVDNGGVSRAYDEGQGNAAEINLALVSMLREAGLTANPVLVSTRSNGIPLFPTTSGFNYVIAAVEMNNEVILLDATEKYSAPNLLPMRDLNWEGRLIRKDGSSMAVNLYPNKYNAKTVKLNVKLEDSGELSGVMISTYKNLGAMIYRKNKGLLSQEELISRIEQDNNDIEVENFRLNNNKSLSKPLTEMVQFVADNQVDMVGNKIYISPLLFLTERENPFKLEDRTYPIDFASAWKDDVNMVMEIPEGYVVESKPEDLVFNLPNGMGTYQLKTQIAGNRITIMSSTKMNMAIIGANYYPDLRNLFTQAIDKQKEKIVLVQGP